MDKRAFTMIELIMIILIIGILAVVAIPRYIALQDQARTAAEQGVVGAVRGGIHIWRANSLSQGVDAWPGALDIANNDGIAFDIVLEQAVPAGGAGQWSEPGIPVGGVIPYTGSAGTAYGYDTADGSFD